MNFIEELRWRGMLHNMTPEIEAILDQQTVVGYIGFDPTADSLTIGNYVQIMILNFFQKHGHTPIVLMGGATGRIGDPSGKDQERQLKTYEELDKNLDRQKEQFRQLLDFESSDNAAFFVNNIDFYQNYNILDFLRDVGKSITVNYMLAKDSVKNRIDKGISFTEFSYQLLQAYDFQCLYERFDCILQMGGSDQWGNITSGTEFIRRNLGQKAHALTTPLLTKADGSKFGKSVDGNIWLDPNKTSPYKFYQFWINADDQDLSKFFRYFSFKKKEEIESLERDFANDPRQLKKILAEELTVRIHGEKAFENVEKVSHLLFNPKAKADFLDTLEVSQWQDVGMEIPIFEINHSTVTSTNLIELLTTETTIFSSKGEARRAISGNALSVNKEKIKDMEFVINDSIPFHDQYILIENGKKNKYLLKCMK